jgi:hypothetical protein
MPGSIQFSYPVMSGTLNQGNITISDDGGGYFQCNYTNSGGTDKYKLFKPTILQFYNDNTMIITHKYINDTLYVKHKINNTTISNEITANNIYLNRSIGDGIESKAITFTEKTCNISSNSNNYYIDMTDVGAIPMKLSKELINTNNNPINSGSYATLESDISLSSGSFVTDEIICDSGNNMNTTTTKTGKNSFGYTSDEYTLQLSKNISISIGVGTVIIFLVILAITKGYGANAANHFPNGTDIFGGWTGGPQIAYNSIGSLFLLAMFTSFMLYGLFVNAPGTHDLNNLTGLLATAIISLILFVFMFWYKYTALIRAV